MVWFAGSIVFDLNTILKYKKKKKSVVLLVFLMRFDGSWLDTFVTLGQDLAKWSEQFCDTLEPPWMASSSMLE